MKADQFTPWVPLPNLKGEFSLEELRYDGEELYLRLLSESSRGLEVKVSFPLSFSFVECSDLESNSDAAPISAAELQAYGSFWTKAVGETAEFLIFSNNHGFLSFETDTEPHISWVDNFFGDAI